MRLFVLVLLAGFCEVAKHSKTGAPDPSKPLKLSMTVQMRQVLLTFYVIILLYGWMLTIHSGSW